MKYFVVSDVHSFYTKMMYAITAEGFDENNPEHKLIICGDLFDRGKEALKMQEYVLHLMDLNKVILVKGNHEDLIQEMVENIHKYLPYIEYTHHYSNGTFDTAKKLTQMSAAQIHSDPDRFAAFTKKLPLFSKIIPSMVDYFETKKYIFVHGWIPCDLSEEYKDMRWYERNPKYLQDWRNAPKEKWEQARWINGMDAAKTFGIVEPNKTIVCGHYHCSFGHFHFENAPAEYGSFANYSPYYSDGIIAIDACTALSKVVNCIVIEDDEM